MQDPHTGYLHDSTIISPLDSTVLKQQGKDSGITETAPLPIPADTSTHQKIDTKNVTRSEVVNFAKTLFGTPYLYASTDPAKGFDCSGFITYVFNHFNMQVPRSSVDFTNVGKEIPKQKARPGDLILFTGTDSSIRIVGHMGIVIDNSDSLRFIHSSSGKAMGVTITPLNKYYSGRFVKVIQIFND